MKNVALLAKVAGACFLIICAIGGHIFENTSTDPRQWVLIPFDLFAIVSCIPNGLLRKRRAFIYAYFSMFGVFVLFMLVSTIISEHPMSFNMTLLSIIMCFFCYLPAISLIMELSTDGTGQSSSASTVDYK